MNKRAEKQPEPSKHNKTGAFFISQGYNGTFKLPGRHPVKSVMISIFISSVTKITSLKYQNVQIFFYKGKRTFLFQSNVKVGPYLLCVYLNIKVCETVLSCFFTERFRLQGYRKENPTFMN